MCHDHEASILLYISADASHSYRRSCWFSARSVCSIRGI